MIAKILAAYIGFAIGIWIVAFLHGNGFFALFDFWMGVFWDAKRRIVYICLLPCLVIKLELKK